jgi:hypothetical protein
MAKKECAFRLSCGGCHHSELTDQNTMVGNTEPVECLEKVSQRE